ncbi:unnamed protein product [Brassicogethes aeneus]|uniref:Cytochrome c oxidase assembly factor 6 homolog n=1 Tax=Brassicogethes aeneus TaxID=1431903 RepID=A0A9P0FMK4_BRAAE|nr:unnamed protein product [Brassicogethes aeneus]
MSFPTKEERSVCWGARDKYWECLDTNPKKENICEEFKKVYEKSCSAQWVKHFDRKRNYLQFKERIEKHGVPNKNINEQSHKQKRRVYQEIACR